MDLGFEDYFNSTGVCVVEWADKADLLWPDEHLRIRLKMMSETKRGLLFTATGVRYCELLQAIPEKYLCYYWLLTLLPVRLALLSAQRTS